MEISPQLSDLGRPELDLRLERGQVHRRAASGVQRLCRLMMVFVLTEEEIEESEDREAMSCLKSDKQNWPPNFGMSKDLAAVDWVQRSRKHVAEE